MNPPSNKLNNIESYRHKGAKRENNPTAGTATEDNDPQVNDKQTYAYDPHLDPQLQWSGKQERPTLKIDTRSLHIHEQIDSKSIISKLEKDFHTPDLNFFDDEKLPLSKAVEFYKHKENWSNRLIAGDSAIIMNSLLVKERMAGKVQCVYMDPPYGIKYQSNFQPFTNQLSVTDRKDNDLSSEPETIKAFRDTWELGVHSYLSYLRDRLLLCRDLLSESGSCFVQIGDENIHHVREIMDEIYGAKNYVSLIAYSSSGSGTYKKVGVRRIHNYIIWYAKNKDTIKFNHLYKKMELEDLDTKAYSMLEESNGNRRKLTSEEKLNIKIIPENSKPFCNICLHSTGAGNNDKREFNGKMYGIPQSGHWRHTISSFEELKKRKRIIASKNSILSIRYWDDFPCHELTTNWTDAKGESKKIYVVQTAPKIIRNCILMSSDPGDLVLDPTCGSGTTAYVAEEYGRRWISCDTSRIALTLAKQRLVTSVFHYYKLANPDAGVSKGFEYDKINNITPDSIAKKQTPEEVTLYDRPKIDSKKARICGPFTMEAVPSPKVIPIKDAKEKLYSSYLSNSEVSSQHKEWCGELRKNGISVSQGKKILFNEVSQTQGMRYVHAQGETNDEEPIKVMISFGPENGTLGAQQVEGAWHEARIEKSDILLFIALQFDPEATKVIDEMQEKHAGMKFLRGQMNHDLTLRDLKKTSSSDSFWLIGQPDVKVHHIKDGEHKGKIQVEIMGYDYYDPNKHEVDSGGQDKIATWMIDEDYDYRCMVPNQIFFPLAGIKHGWDIFAKNLRAEIDEDKLAQYKSTKSIPFEVPKSKTIAIKITDTRAIESIKIIKL